MSTAASTPSAPDLLVIALALGSAAAYGAADFWGGLASRRAASSAIVTFTQGSSALVLLIGMALWPSPLTAADLAWGAASGLAGVAGVLLLYKGLADGRMSVVAPLTGLTAAGLPVAFSPFLGEVPGTLALVGIAVALASIVLVSREPSPAGEDPSPGTKMTTAAMVRIGLASGAAFGLLFILLDQTSPASGTWPLVANKLAGFAVVLLQALFLNRSGLRFPRSIWPAVAACAVLGTGAELLYLFATQRGLVAIAAVLTSLYPASTVLLARFVLHERLRRDQLAGFALAAVAVALIATGAA
jgi:drug/metabolite transporter (DMT)-like permease